MNYLPYTLTLLGESQEVGLVTPRNDVAKICIINNIVTRVC